MNGEREERHNESLLLENFTAGEIDQEEVHLNQVKGRIGAIGGKGCNSYDRNKYYIGRDYCITPRPRSAKS